MKKKREKMKNVESKNKVKKNQDVLKGHTEEQRKLA